MLIGAGVVTVNNGNDIEDRKECRYHFSPRIFFFSMFKF